MSLLASVCLLLLLAPHSAPRDGRDEENAVEGSSTACSFPELGLTLDLGELAPVLERRKMNSARVRASWKGDLGGSYVQVNLQVLPRVQFGLNEPNQVTTQVEAFEQSRARKNDRPFRVVTSELQGGPFGWTAYASIVGGPTYKGDKETGELICLGSILEENGYFVEVRCEPALDDDWREAILEFLREGVRYEGPVRDAQWTDEEATERWKRDAPDDLADDLNAIWRTDHYIILSNKKKPKLFAKKMEECYREIREIYPFEDAEAQRLMPMFIFVTPDQYYDFCRKVAGMDRDSARRTKGHAWKDYYATWYEAPNDPVHIHEAVHQIFSQRLFLHGGGSWFQEGVAEYVESSKNDRNIVARHVKKGEHVRLRDFVLIQSLALTKSSDEKKTGSRAGDNYKQAALLIEFLRESKWGRDGFEEFLVAMGRTPRADLEAIEETFQQIYGVGLDAVDEEFMKYAKKR